MGFWGRVQVNGALQRLGKRIAANPYLWQPAVDGRPHFDHWIEEHASDGDLIRAAAELVSFLTEIPARYSSRDWAQQLRTIIEGSLECIKLELQRREELDSESNDDLAGDGPNQTVTPRDSQQGDSSRSGSTALREGRQPIVELYAAALSRREAKFAGEIHDEADARTIRLTAMVEATLELYETQVPGMGKLLKNSAKRQNVAQNLLVENMPLMMLDPGELPHVFAEYMMWTYGRELEGGQVADTDYLKAAFLEGISRLPADGPERMIAGKNRFKWGELI